MARYTGPRVRIIRRFLQELPGLTSKTTEARPYPPGQHGPTSRSKPSSYRIRLDEKQKLRFNYGLSERQLRSYFKRATHIKGDKGHTLLALLESRLDNLVFRAGFAPTIPGARQLIQHGHVRINDKKVDIASMMPRVGDTIALAETSKVIPMVAASWASRALEVPACLEVDDAKMQAKLVQKPAREQVPFSIKEHLVVEFYS